MQHRLPIFLRRLGSPGAESFATLFALESLARAVIATVIPLEALRLVGDAQGVSTLFFAASLIALVGGLLVPLVVRRTARRWVYSAGVLLLAAGSALAAAGTLEIFIGGVMLRALGTVTVMICFTLYIMDFIARRDFSRSEPLRLLYSAAAWSLGPFLGVYLAERLHPWSPYLLAAATALATLGYFWFLRMTDDPAVTQKAGPTPSPLRYLGRYFAQPRLALAWVLSMGRNVWWVIFFIYVPIYAVETGLGAVAGGAIVSCGTAFLFLMPLFGRVLRGLGIRRVFILGYLLSGALTLALVPAWDHPWLGAALLVSAAFGMVAVDAAGNVVFMLAVRPRERPEMTAVYSTYRDAADILPPGAFALLLRFFELPVVFVTAGLTALGLAAFSSRLHPRLGRDRAARTGAMPQPVLTAGRSAAGGAAGR